MRKFFWLLVALIGAVAVGGIALQRGETIMISGKVTEANHGVLLNYYEGVARATINGIPLKVGQLVTPPARPDASGSPMIYWSFTAKIEKGAR